MGSRPRVGWLARRLVLGVVLVVVGALAVTGCAGIPTTGPVLQGAEVGGARDDPFIRVIASPPRTGMTPQEVVSGFLHASASFDDDHAVARLYLAPESRAGWNPLVGTVVYADTGSSLVEATAGRVVFRATRTGTVSARGEYASAGAGAVVATTFHLRRVEGEWRVVDPPAGLLLTDLDVERAFRTFDLYFPDPSRTVLVPNQVLLPVGPGVTTTLVRALLEGPTPWLAPAVRTAVPTGTELAVDAAPLRDGVVQVDLTAPAARAVGDEAAALSAQVVWTLRQLSDVSGVRITVEGLPLSVPGAGPVQPRDSWPQYDPDVLGESAAGYLVADGRLSALRGEAPVPVPGPTGDGRTVLGQPAVSTDEKRVAGLDAAGRSLLVGDIGADEAVGPVLAGTSLTAPCWDVLGTVWTADRRPDGSVAVWAMTGDEPPTAVEVTGLPAGTVTSLVVSRDGARVAAVVRRGTSGRLMLGRVERAPGLLRLSGFRPLESALTDVRDVAWSSADEVAVLGRIDGGVAEPFLVELTGSVARGLGSLGTEMLSLAAAPGQPTLAGTADGRVWQHTGFGWAAVGAGQDPAYPG